MNSQRQESYQNRNLTSDKVNIYSNRRTYDPYQSYGYPRQLARGLANRGNTCYVNSALQCFHKTEVINKQKIFSYNHESSARPLLR